LKIFLHSKSEIYSEKILENIPWFLSGYYSSIRHYALITNQSIMERTNFLAKGQEALKPLFAMGHYVNKSRIEKKLQELVKLRVSQINGCAYCIDMHWKDARAIGETEQRLYGLNAWHESPYYSERERAAMQWAEAVTLCKVSDAVYAEAAQHFTEEELIDLTMVATNTGTWNRLNISFPNAVGTYAVGQWG
jgi:AhpD family alkylhydroperoxidase